MDLDEEQPQEVVRAFMLTGLRTRSEVDVALEAMVRATKTSLDRRRLTTEQMAVLRMAESPLSAAEISAHLRLPLRTALVLVGDLIRDGFMSQADTVDEATFELLDNIRLALEAL